MNTRSVKGAMLTDIDPNGFPPSLQLHVAQGGVIVLKIDGERAEAMWTLIVSGGQLGADYFHSDGASLSDLLVAAASFLREHGQ